jgi:ethanolamine ammonia-lyase small subunit
MPDPWDFLKTHTAARIAQGRAGHSLPTNALLAFQLDHARARDAVYATLDRERLLTELQKLTKTAPIAVQSLAHDRPTYLRRPDFGRQLNPQSALTLSELSPKETPILCIVLADGLSATAVNRHGLAVVSGLVQEARRLGWQLAPVVLAEQSRVALGDEIAGFLGAEMVVVVLGERPGLSSPDSLGAYLTFAPRPGLTDESRNCVSNIRPDGLPPELAVQKIIYLLTEFKIRRLSGVLVKDEMGGFLPQVG